MAENHHPAPFRTLAGPVLVVLLIAGFFWKLTLTRQYTWLDSFDFYAQVMPWAQFTAGEIHAGRIPLWNPYEWAGQPYLAQMLPQVACPLAWILYLLPLQDGWVRMSSFHGYFVFLHVLGGLFAYWLCRDLQRSRFASVVGGVAFALCGFMGNTDWPQMLDGALWQPLAWLFLLRAMRGTAPLRNACFAGATVGMAVLSGHHQAPLIFTLGLACAWLWHCGSRWRTEARGLAWQTGGMAVFAGLVASLQVIPALEYANYAVRWVGAANPIGRGEAVPYHVHAFYSFLPASLLHFAVPLPDAMGVPFTGLTLLALAGIAVVRLWHDATVRLFAALTAFGLLYALGQFGLVEGLLYGILPEIEKARSAHSAILICSFTIAVLSAYGIDCYLKITNRILWIIPALLLGLVAMQTALARPVDRFVSLGALATGGVLLLFGSGISRRALRFSLLAGVLIELSWVAGGNFQPVAKPESFLRKMTLHADTIEFLQQQPSRFRMEYAPEAFPYNAGDWLGIDQTGSYLASVTNDAFRLTGAYWGRRMTGSRYYVGYQPSGERDVEVFRGRDGLKVYANADAFPPAWVVHKAVQIHTDQERTAKLEAGGDALRTEAFLTTAAPRLEVCAGAEPAEMIDRLPNRVTLEAELRCTGMVVLGDTWYPGWQATIDGRPAAILEVYTGLRGVVAGPGRHRIEYRFRPRSVLLGAVLTATGLLGVLGLALTFRRRERHGEAGIL